MTVVVGMGSEGFSEAFVEAGLVAQAHGVERGYLPVGHVKDVQWAGCDPSFHSAVDDRASERGKFQ